MQEQLDEINRDVKEIKDALLGTEYTDNNGMIHEVKRNSKFRHNSGWWATFFTGIGTFIGGLLSYIKFKIFGV